MVQLDLNAQFATSAPLTAYCTCVVICVCVTSARFSNGEARAADTAPCAAQLFATSYAHTNPDRLI